MNTVVHITGTSSGLGKGLAEFFLSKPNCKVVGYSRREGPQHEKYTHVSVDLTMANSQEFLAIDPSAEKEILINNAGWIGPVSPIGELDAQGISKMFEVNVSAVMRWTDHFVRSSTAKAKTVVSISSGAASNAIPSWSAYCASKAAIDMMTRVWVEDRDDVHFLSIAPGVVDTEMQADIRSTDPSAFPDRDRFIGLHENGELKSPKEIAELIGNMALCPDDAPSSVFSVRDL